MKNIIAYILLCTIASVSSVYSMGSFKGLFRKKTAEEKIEEIRRKRAEIRQTRRTDQLVEEDARIVQYCNTLAENARHPLNNDLADNIQLSLQKFGADPNAVLFNIQYETPLHATASAAHAAPTLKTLLEFNADPNIPDIKGKTPLHIACLRNNPDAITMLTAHGAAHTKDQFNKLPFDYAAAQKENPAKNLVNKALPALTEETKKALMQNKLLQGDNGIRTMLLIVGHHSKNKPEIHLLDNQIKLLTRESTGLPDAVCFMIFDYWNDAKKISTLPPLTILHVLGVPVTKESMDATKALLAFNVQLPRTATQSRSALDGIERTESKRDDEDIEEATQTQTVRTSYSTTSSAPSSRVSHSSSSSSASSTAANTTIQSLDTP